MSAPPQAKILKDEEISSALDRFMKAGTANSFLENIYNHNIFKQFFSEDCLNIYRESNAQHESQPQ